jgi:predicted permease
LLVCSVLVVKSLQKALDAPIGYNPRGAVTVSYDLNIQGYKETQGREFHRRLIEKVRAIPGIESATMVDALPLSLNSSSNSIFIEGQPKPKAAEAPIAYAYTVASDYFKTMQTKLLNGREFDTREKPEGTRVAIVNRAFADKLLRGADPIGKRFSTGSNGKPLEIVGVAEDGKYFSLTESRHPAMWTPLEMFYSANVSVVARTKLSDTEAVRLIRGTVREMDPNVALYATGSMVEMLNLPLFPARLAASALGAFGLLAAILAATGIYGVMAYSVSRRTREIGIRMAIGASQGNVLGMIARRAAILIGTGTIVGLGAALLLGRLLSQILYGVEPTDPLTYVIVFSMMASIALLACWIPARRAIRINPINSLRQE